jgi:hypothetical protein
LRVQNSSGSVTSQTTGNKVRHFTQHITTHARTTRARTRARAHAHTHTPVPTSEGQGHCGMNSLQAVHRTYLPTLQKHGICVTAHTYLWPQAGLWEMLHCRNEFNTVPPASTS